ncbi:hypothetical protein S101446_02722 [Komagataeibacter europaeus]|nr:hypothetical protein [Komagataeibacter europaeus]ARW17807.1 hypothetical protein S101446_02722 [Komagataeibacter europaeus]
MPLKRLARGARLSFARLPLLGVAGGCLSRPSIMCVTCGRATRRRVRSLPVAA